MIQLETKKKMFLCYFFSRIYFICSQNKMFMPAIYCWASWALKDAVYEGCPPSLTKAISDVYGFT